MITTYKYPLTLLLAFVYASVLSAYEDEPEKESPAFTVVTYDLNTDERQDDSKQTEDFLRRNSRELRTLMAASPDVVNLQGVPLGGIQWLEKTYGANYRVIYAAKHTPNSDDKVNDYLAILYKKDRYELLKKENFNSKIRTKYFQDNTGHLVLMAEVKDKLNGMPVTFVNTRLNQGMNFLKRKKEAEELILYLQKYPFAVVAGDFKGTPNSVTMAQFTKYGFVADPVSGSTLAEAERKSDTILYKGSGRSHFIADQCRVERDISGSQHYPLSCRIYLK